MVVATGRRPKPPLHSVLQRLARMVDDRLAQCTNGRRACKSASASVATYDNVEVGPTWLAEQLLTRVKWSASDKTSVWKSKQGSKIAKCCSQALATSSIRFSRQLLLTSPLLIPISSSAEPIRFTIVFQQRSNGTYQFYRVSPSAFPGQIFFTVSGQYETSDYLLTFVNLPPVRHDDYYSAQFPSNNGSAETRQYFGFLHVERKTPPTMCCMVQQPSRRRGVGFQLLKNDKQVTSSAGGSLLF